ncbi:MAG: glycosyltransferase family 1 protein [Candidatus Shapirobacteria bacterium]|jgi:glycosyltransferase involved in cell wall biosynthesis
MAKQIKVALDISPLKDGNANRGMGYYVRNLLTAMQSQISSNPNFKNFKISEVRNWKLEIGNFDLLHIPYFNPFSPSYPIHLQIPTVITVPDLIPIAYKKHYTVGIKGTLNWWRQKLFLKNIPYIITIAHSQKYIIHKITGYPLDRIYVTWLAAASHFKPETSKIKLNQIKKKYNLPDKFVLYVGDINWNKNIPRLVSSCLDLKYPLVIVGSSATRKNITDHPWNQDLLWVQSHSNQITLTGFVPDEDIPVIYSLATIYCQPSYSEGFGLPLVEAMKTGCPVSYSQEPTCQEIMDYHGDFFDPNSTAGLKDSLKRLWSDPELRKKLAIEGLKHSQIFDWKLTAIQTLTLYSQIYHENH